MTDTNEEKQQVEDQTSQPSEAPSEPQAATNGEAKASPSEEQPANAAPQPPQEDEAQAPSTEPEAQADDAEAQPTEDASGDADEGAANADEASEKKSDRPRRSGDISRELRELVELATQYPEIGPPLARLAFKLGQREIGERVLRMGFEDEERGVEFHFVAANVARREDRYEDVLENVTNALNDFVASPPDNLEEEGQRLLHLVRVGFAVLMFDLDSIESAPQFVQMLQEQLPKLEPHFENDSFYYSLLAQAQWFGDRELSEKTWDRAVEGNDAESAWNARGTWYKEAEKDMSRAEGAYRSGLQADADSSLLRLNLAQVLMDRAEDESTEPDQAANWLKECEGLLKNALRQAPRGLRRHIHENLDRLNEVRNELPDAAREPNEGEVVRGRVVSLVPYGAFLTIGGGHKGLLHKSEIAHEWVDDPAHHVRVGDHLKVKIIEIKPREDGEGLRISLSRKALLPAPEKSEKEEQRKKGGKRGRRSSGSRNKGKKGKKRSEEGFTLGELLMSKLSESEKDKS